MGTGYTGEPTKATRDSFEGMYQSGSKPARAVGLTGGTLNGHVDPYSPPRPQTIPL